MSSKVGGIARAPVWGANPSLNNNTSSVYKNFVTFFLKAAHSSGIVPFDLE